MYNAPELPADRQVISLPTAILTFKLLAN